MSRQAPWERRDDETPRAYSAFRAYVAIPPNERSIPRALSDAGGSPGNRRVWERWSTRFEWTRRADSWDGFVDQRRTEELLASALRAAERQAPQIALVIRAACLAAVALAERMRTAEGEEAVRAELEELSAPALLDLAARTSRGLDRLLAAEREAHGWRRETAEMEADVAGENARMGAASDPDAPLEERFPDLYAATSPEHDVLVIEALRQAGCDARGRPFRHGAEDEDEDDGDAAG